MISSPQVSVIVPAYNAERTIREALHSVLAQTTRDFEIIVFDDASSDATLAAVRSIHDDRIRSFANEVNLGPGATRDRAIAAAKGRWIALLDADDIWAPQRLDRLLAATGGSEDCIAFDNILMCHDTNSGLKPWRPLRRRGAFDQDGTVQNVRLASLLRSERLLVKPMIPAIHARAVRHSARSFAEDIEYIVQFVRRGLNLVYVSEPLYLYRISPMSLTASATPHAMRQCIEDCFALGWKDEDIEMAFEYKIGRLRSNELLYELFSMGKRLDIAAIFRQLVRTPQILFLLPKHALRIASFQWSRVIHGGHPRRSLADRS